MIVSEAIFAPVTAVLAIAAVSTASSANSFAETELLASSVEVTEAEVNIAPGISP